MGLFDFIYGSMSTTDIEQNDTKHPEALSAPIVEIEQHSPVPSSRFSSSVDVSEPPPPSPSDAAASKVSPSAAAKEADNGHSIGGTKPLLVTRGFSFHSLAFISNGNVAKPALSTVQEHKKEIKASAAFFRRRAKVPKADKRAEQSALIVRSLIIGVYPAPSTTSSGVSMPQLSKVKSQLMQPKTANKVIAQLRALPASDGKDVAKGGKADVGDKPVGPVHAVCLDTTDAEAEKRYFSRLTKEGDVVELTVESTSSPSVASASIDKLANMFKNMHIISLIVSPDFGLGQPGDGHGILSGAIPTAETIISGIEQITPQLMALGLATGKSVLPDHNGSFLRPFSVVETHFTGCRCLSSNRPHFGLDMCIIHPTFSHDSLLTFMLRLVGTGSRTACFYPSLPLGMYNIWLSRLILINSIRLLSRLPTP